MKNVDRLVYELVRKIPKGKVSTYGNVAKALGIHPRTVGMILNRNTEPSVRCYRIVKSDGSTGGYNAGPKRKILLLRKNGIRIRKGMIELKRYQYEFK